MWDDAEKGAFQLLYISPEMLKSPKFRKLWCNKKFVLKVIAVFVDEAHCVHEWGDGYIPTYRVPSSLWTYVGYEVPIVACSATISTLIFDKIFDSLAYGNRPFFGIDAGTDWHNLRYLLCPAEYPKNPALDALNITPHDLTATSTPEDLPSKTIFYIQNKHACCEAVHTIWKCLPEHLQKLVYAYSSDLSEEAKQEQLKRGNIRILFCTDAARMGCNIADIDVVIAAGEANAASAVVQRWSRAARKRDRQGVCLWLAPRWGFRQVPQSVLPGVKQKKQTTEPIAHEIRRSKAEHAMIDICNLKTGKGCIHEQLQNHFRLDSRLDTYGSLDQELPSSTGLRS
ncbi:ATP-dependent DNA helicase sgs1 [Tulasnella sp. JGI-2019a]|nr:ATP-dependent DNA helicase sgs1 [Tulasnella sp. JGI-2019a]